MCFKTINPKTNLEISTYSYYTVEELERVLDSCKDSYTNWKLTSMSERKALFLSLKTALLENIDTGADLCSSEMGKTVEEARAEITKCALLIEKTVENIDSWLSPESIEADGIEHQITYEATGTVLAIMPWNFPFWQALRAAVTNIIAGNTLMLKHADSVTGCSLFLEKMFQLAGFPKNVFTTILCSHENIEVVISNPIISGVAFTGSERGGKEVAQICGRNLKKVILELGGSDPFIVFADADLNKAAEQAVISRFMNGGQVCISAKRFILHKDIKEEFLNIFKSRLKEYSVNPLINKSAVVELEKQLEDAINKGANIFYQGEKVISEGNYFSPVILTDITSNMLVACEEVFGPIASIFEFSEVDEAIEIANSTRFGLGASVWSRDLEFAKEIGSKVDSGALFVNSLVKSDPMIPFGGSKSSGFGVEMHKYGVLEFLNIKGNNIYS